MKVVSNQWHHITAATDTLHIVTLTPPLPLCCVVIPPCPVHSRHSCGCLADTPSKIPDAPAEAAGAGFGPSASQDLAQPAAASPGTYAATATPFQGGSHSILAPHPSIRGAPSAGLGSVPGQVATGTGTDSLAALQPADDSQVQSQVGPINLDAVKSRVSFIMPVLSHSDIILSDKHIVSLAFDWNMSARRQSNANLVLFDAAFN